MKEVTLGKTKIITKQNAFGCLPIQRDDTDLSVRLLRKAWDGGMTFFDTARAYTDSEEKMGKALFGADPEKYGGPYVKREDIIIASKTNAKDTVKFWSDLNESLSLLNCGYLDIYQLHCVPQCFRPGDGTGLYEAMLEARDKGLIRHIGITTHKIGVAEEIIDSGLYETLQYPFSYLAAQREVSLVKKCCDAGIGFIAMKALAGGLITNSRAAQAYMTQFDGVVPIWGIQRERELLEFLSYMEEPPEMDDEIRAFIEKERTELSGDFCRGCGYCKPCPVGIKINECARISLMIRRAPSKRWLSEEFQLEMKKIEDCIGCRQCVSKCPYELDTPELLKKNYEDYQDILAGRVSIN
ncbi:MAG: aldo/keto reductase [Lachnospiraceae bacterium]|nr:aldo/keto reductase [Lachnospiraceae bacterium]